MQYNSSVNDEDKSVGCRFESKSSRLAGSDVINAAVSAASAAVMSVRQNQSSV